MSQLTAETPRPFPSWAREIASLLSTSALFVVSGNVRDIYFTPDLRVRELHELMPELLEQQGISKVEVVRAAGQAPTAGGGKPAPSARVPEVPIADIGARARELTVTGEPRALIVLDASRAVAQPGSLTDEESAMFRDLRRAIDDQPASDGPFNPVIWVVDADHDVPAWLCGGNPRGRVVSIPLPTASERDVLAGRQLGGTLKGADQTVLDVARRTLVDQTDALPLRSVSQITRLARARGGTLDALDDAIRVFRFGVLENPWKQPYLSARLRNEVVAGPEGSLRRRILGQHAPIAKSLDVLVRSVTGLRSAQSTTRSGKPRGVLFFAGPTGVGKTELAKALAALLFGDEGSMIRFDMSEFASAQSVERLVGAPPGYIGFAQGGELTNAVRQRPFSLLLFDEIEKADHRLLDRFLQILDDGRLTDGRGETTYFTETVIVFTSNLGIYDEITEPGTGRVTGRTLAVRPADGYEALAASVERHVKDHFTEKVGRPELLNRIGDNIVVFDFIRPDVARAILRLMVANVGRAMGREYDSELELSETAWSALEEQCLAVDNLMMGGRGIGNRMETVLVDPLARWAFSQDRLPSRVRIEAIRPLGQQFTIDVAAMGR